MTHIIEEIMSLVYQLLGDPLVKFGGIFEVDRQYVVYFKDTVGLDFYDRVSSLEELKHRLEVYQEELFTFEVPKEGGFLHWLGGSYHTIHHVAVLIAELAAVVLMISIFLRFK